MANPGFFFNFKNGFLRICPYFVKKFLGDIVGESLLTAGGETWRMHRRKLTPSFHFKVMQDFEQIMNETAMTLVRRLSEQIARQDGQLVEIKQDVTTPDVATKLVSKILDSTQMNAQNTKPLDVPQRQLDVNNLDIRRLLRSLTLDIFAESSLGVKLDTLTNGDSEIGQSLDYVLEIIAGRICDPLQWNDVMFRLTNVCV